MSEVKEESTEGECPTGAPEHSEDASAEETEEEEENHKERMEKPVQSENGKGLQA